MELGADGEGARGSMSNSVSPQLRKSSREGDLLAPKQVGAREVQQARGLAELTPGWPGQRLRPRVGCQGHGRGLHPLGELVESSPRGGPQATEQVGDRRHREMGPYWRSVPSRKKGPL
jgi:hypothetical protein